MKRILFASMVVCLLSLSPATAKTWEPRTIPTVCLPLEVSVQYRGEWHCVIPKDTQELLFKAMYQLIRYDLEQIWKFLYRNVLSVEQ